MFPNSEDNGWWWVPVILFGKMFSRKGRSFKPFLPLSHEILESKGSLNIIIGSLSSPVCKPLLDESYDSFIFVSPATTQGSLACSQPPMYVCWPMSYPDEEPKPREALRIPETTQQAGRRVRKNSVLFNQFGRHSVWSLAQQQLHYLIVC